MSDHLLAGTLRVMILGLISLCGALAVLLSYQSLLQLISGDIKMLAAKLLWAIALAVAAAMLIKYRGDLVDD